jgi:hypothetical protein
LGIDEALRSVLELVFRWASLSAHPWALPVVCVWGILTWLV